MRKIKVLCVDDSALIRSIISNIVNQQADMEMVATAPNPLIARDLIKQFNPDVLTLDVEMPHMDGLDFLERLMRLRPMPVIMVSSLTTRGSETTLNALELGAVDFVTKPDMRFQQSLAQYAELISEKIRIAARVRLKRSEKLLPLPTLTAGPLAASDKVIAIGASTGGTEALRRVLVPLPLSCPAIVIAQHMPPGFTRSFAERLNSLCQITVKEAEEGERVQPGHAYIAPGDHHMELVRNSGHYQIALNQRPHINRHRPSVDALFHSVAKSAAGSAIGVILTGMGSDGARGLLAMRHAGAPTLAQSEKSCVVFGMPREAIEADAACSIVDLNDISQQILSLATGSVRNK